MDTTLPPMIRLSILLPLGEIAEIKNIFVF